MTHQTALGRPLWYELRTNDLPGAESFYSAVVGWTTAPYSTQSPRYDTWMRAGDIGVGGVMDASGMPISPQWVVFIGVPKVEDAVARIQQLGGATNSPVIEVPDIGRMQGAQDPQGAVFWVYEPAPGSEDMEEAQPEVGDLSWLELYTTDAQAAVAFYSELFGWRESQVMDMGVAGKYHIFARQWDLGGIMNKPPEMAHLPTTWGLYFRVADVVAAAARVTANGGEVLYGPAEVPGGDQIVNCMDPQGAMFSLHQKHG